MTKFKFQSVKRYKRGAFWSPGDPRLCIRCKVHHRNEGTRSSQAVMTADLVIAGSPWTLPVAYCPDHAPEEEEK